MNWFSKKVGPQANVFGKVPELWAETNALVFEIKGSLKNIESEVSELKSEVSEIKAMLREKQ